MRTTKFTLYIPSTPLLVKVSKLTSDIAADRSFKFLVLEMIVIGMDVVTVVEVAAVVVRAQSCWATRRVWSNSSDKPVTSVSLSEMASIATVLTPPSSWSVVSESFEDPSLLPLSDVLKIRITSVYTLLDYISYDLHSDTKWILALKTRVVKRIWSLVLTNLEGQ